MKKIMLTILALLPVAASAIEKPFDYTFFENSRMDGDYFYSKVDYTSPSWVENSRKRLPVDADYVSPTMCRPATRCVCTT